MSWELIIISQPLQRGSKIHSMQIKDIHLLCEYNYWANGESGD